MFRQNDCEIQRLLSIELLKYRREESRHSDRGDDIGGDDLSEAEGFEDVYDEEEEAEADESEEGDDEEIKD